jgi:hypothetical protein
MPKAPLAAVLSFATALLLMFAIGCNTASLTPRSGDDASCPLQIEYPCKVQPPGNGGCAANPQSSDPVEARIAADASYPIGCTVIVPDPVPDESGGCAVKGSCECDAPDASTPRWTCTPPP